MGPGHSVSYQPKADSLIRTEVGAGNTARREVFALDSGLAARFEIRENAPLTFVVLLVEPGKARRTAASVPRLRAGGTLG